jgi:hypothetical protein
MQTGGELIGRGGFGCVFRPPLAFSREDHSQEGARFVSKDHVEIQRASTDQVVTMWNTVDANALVGKLMTEKNAIEEMANLSTAFIAISRVWKENAQAVSKTIFPPFFLMVKNMHLSRQDKHDLEKVYAHRKKNASSNLLTLYNTKGTEGRDTLRMLISEYAGISIPRIVTNRQETMETRLRVLFTLMVQLFSAFPEMVAAGLFHSDVKHGNIAIQFKGPDRSSIQLIDWGLSFVYQRGTHHADNYKVLQQRSVQSNVPFAALLLSQEIADEWVQFLNKVHQHRLELLSRESGATSEIIRTFVRRCLVRRILTKKQHWDEILRKLSPFMFQLEEAIGGDRTSLDVPPLTVNNKPSSCFQQSMVFETVVSHLELAFMSGLSPDRPEFNPQQCFERFVAPQLDLWGGIGALHSVYGQCQAEGYWVSASKLREWFLFMWSGQLMQSVLTRAPNDDMANRTRVLVKEAFKMLQEVLTSLTVKTSLPAEDQSPFSGTVDSHSSSGQGRRDQSPAKLRPDPRVANRAIRLASSTLPVRAQHEKKRNQRDGRHSHRHNRHRDSSPRHSHRHSRRR